MNIVELTDLLYPGEIDKGNISFVQEVPDGPILIGHWAVEGVVKPTEASILAKANDPDVLHKKQCKVNCELNKPILVQLDALDLRSIRALRAGDQTYIQQYEQEAQELRAQLLPMS